MLLTALTKFLNGRATSSSFGDHFPLLLSKAEIRFMSGFPFAKAFATIEHMLEAG